MWLDPNDPLVDELWSDAPSSPVLGVLLQAAEDQCAAYAPVLAEGEAVPARYQLAVVMQARATYRSFKAGSGDLIGPDGMTVTVWPMDRSVKALLRPPRLQGPR